MKQLAKFCGLGQCPIVHDDGDPETVIVVGWRALPPAGLEIGKDEIPVSGSSVAYYRSGERAFEGR